MTWRALLADVVATPPRALLLGAASDGAQLRHAQRIRLRRDGVHPQAPASRAHRMGVVSRVRRGQQRGLRRAVGRVGSLSVLHALGTDRRGSLAHRSLEFGRLLARAADAGRRQPRLSPKRGGHAAVAPAGQCAVGWLFIAVAVAYVLLVAVWRAPVRVRGFSVPPPRVRLAIAQLTVSAIDWTLAAAVLYVLLPPSPATFVNVLARVSSGAASRSRQSCSRWHRRVRRSHRLRALAVPDRLAARAGARRLPRDLLRRTAVGRARRPGGR